MPTVTIYTTPTCVYCNVAKDFFKENNIVFEEKNVATDQEALQEMVKKSGMMSVPVIDIDGNVLAGFNKDEVAKALGIEI